MTLPLAVSSTAVPASGPFATVEPTRIVTL